MSVPFNVYVDQLMGMSIGGVFIEILGNVSFQLFWEILLCEFSDLRTSCHEKEDLITQEEAAAFARDHGLPYVETSALLNQTRECFVCAVSVTL